MARQNFASFFADVCADGCRGIWFDDSELQRVDSAKKGAGPALEAAAEPVAPHQGAVEPAISERSCPRCDRALEEVDYELQPKVVLDECSQCHGVFLDAGELAVIRSRELTSKEKAQLRRSRWSRRRRRAERERQRRFRHATLVLHTLT